jgi:hypothetical protein
MRILTSVLLGLAITACTAEETDTGTGTDTDTMGGTDTDDGGTTDPGTDPVEMDAMLRVIHLSPDAPAVDIFANAGADAAVSGLEFEQGTDYLSLPAGTYDFQISAAGTTAADAVLEIPGLMLDAGVAYTAAAYDEVGMLTAMALVDDSEGIAAGNIRLQVSHTAVGVGTVDVWELTGGAILIEDFEFGASGVLDVPGGALEIGLDLDDDATPDVTFSVPDLGADALVNVYAVTDAMGTPFLLAHLPDGFMARVDAN